MRRYRGLTRRPAPQDVLATIVAQQRIAHGHFEGVGGPLSNRRSPTGQVHDLFRVGRHLLRAANYRVLRGCAFATWHEVARVQCNRGINSPGDWIRLSWAKLTKPFLLTLTIPSEIP
jgi:hypothetical protein